MIIFILYQVLEVDHDQQVNCRRVYICENIDLVKLWLEAVTGCLSENRCLEEIKDNLKLNQVPWKMNKKKIIINNTTSLQPTTLLKTPWWIVFDNFDIFQVFF